MVSEFDTMISTCRNAYSAFQQLAGRTDDALYQALGQVHALQVRMHTDTALSERFNALLQKHVGGKCANETLFLVKYAFFPHTLQPGPQHKADITKASRYAKLINRALAHNIPLDQFVAFARQHGIQRTAVSSHLGKRSHLRAGRRLARRSRSSVSSVTDGAAFVQDILNAVETWFYRADLAARMAQLLRDAQQQPQKLSLTVYVNHERAVVTGCNGRAWHGKFPEGVVRASSPLSAQQLAPAGHEPPPKPPPALRSSRLPPHRRAPARTSLVRRGRHRNADGYLWPSWRAPR
jgi:hypothetical protein